MRILDSRPVCRRARKLSGPTARVDRSSGSGLANLYEKWETYCTMTQQSSTNAPAPPAGPSGKTLGVLITMTALLMLFSVAMWKLGNQTLAASAGVAAIALIGDICRRLLGTSDTLPVNSPSTPPVEATSPDEQRIRPAAPAPGEDPNPGGEPPAGGRTA